MRASINIIWVVEVSLKPPEDMTRHGMGEAVSSTLSSTYIGSV